MCETFAEEWAGSAVGGKSGVREELLGKLSNKLLFKVNTVGAATLSTPWPLQVRLGSAAGYNVETRKSQTATASRMRKGKEHRTTLS